MSFCNTSIARQMSGDLVKLSGPTFTDFSCLCFGRRSYVTDPTAYHLSEGVLVRQHRSICHHCTLNHSLAEGQVCFCLPWHTNTHVCLHQINLLNSTFFNILNKQRKSQRRELPFHKQTQQCLGRYLAFKHPYSHIVSYPFISRIPGSVTKKARF